MLLIFDALKLNLVVIFALFLPGYFLLRVFAGKNSKPLPRLETLIFSFALSIGAVDFLMMFMDRFRIPLNRLSIFTALAAFILVGFLFAGRFRRKIPPEDSADTIPKKRKINLLFLLVFCSVVIIRLFFLSERTFPQTTDLGHHMYWAKHIIHFQSLPDYGMPDFIIGEHIIFAVISSLSGINLISTMPIAILLLINLVSILAAALLAREIAFNFTSGKNSQMIFIFTLITLGILYPISSPQAKFISGGVIGNVIGNLLIPLCFYAALKTFRQRDKKYSLFFVVFAAIMAYTHHLSSFIFLYSFAGFIFLFFIGLMMLKPLMKFKTGEIAGNLKNFFWLFFTPRVLSAVFGVIVFIFFVKIPSYLNPSAIDIAVGAPSKSTRVGMDLNALMETAGAWRFFYGAVGIGVLLALFMSIRHQLNASRKISSWAVFSLSAAWFIMIFIMSFKPAYLKIDIPSGRIASYLTYPAAVFSAFGAFYFLKNIRLNFNKKIFVLLFAAIFGTAFISGMKEIADNKKEETNNKEVAQTYAAAAYLKEKIHPGEEILKDHVCLSGDTWIKLFFMEGYRYPLSRTLLKRYEDSANSRETCTRDMVAIPDSSAGRQCFLENKVKYIMLKNGCDTAQFDASKNFSKIFTSESAVIYQRNY